MRLDRSLSLGLFSPLMNVRFGTRPRCLPVLMYHSISDSPEPGASPYYKLCTSPQRFAEQMEWLAELGYRGVTLTEGLRLLAEGPEELADQRQPTGDHRPRTAAHFRSRSRFHSREGKASPVAITFDDGYADFYSTAFPILQEHGFGATMYLPTAFISNRRQSFKSRPCLTWWEVRELATHGIEFGSHTVNHPTLYKLPWPAIDQELTDSKASIEQALGIAVRSFAYPYAFPRADTDFVLRFCHLLVRSDYRNNVTTTVGRVSREHNPFLIKRLPANEDDDTSLMAAKLTGAYDWFGVPQTIVKSLRHTLRLNRSRWSG